MYFPDDVELLQRMAEVLPAGKEAFGGIFTNLVLNFGVSTMGHRDDDFCLCVVFTLGAYTGGALALHEPRLVLDLKPGSIVAFPSDKFTHFNEPMQGLRISTVLHTEKSQIRWLKDRHGWGPNIDNTDNIPPSIDSTIANLKRR